MAIAKSKERKRENKKKLRALEIGGQMTNASNAIACILCGSMHFNIYFYVNFLVFGFDLLAVQNERQPRNTATIRPEAFRDMDQSRALREAAVAVGVFA